MSIAELEQRHVAPYYLAMMATNALSHDVPRDELLASARQLADDDLVMMLRAGWRSAVMGAWFAAGRTGDEVTTALLRALSTSFGRFTAPPLATVAVHTVGPAAAEALQTYLRADLEHGYGSAGFVAAALEHLGSPPSAPPVEAGDREQLAAMLALAASLAELWRDDLPGTAGAPG